MKASVKVGSFSSSLVTVLKESKFFRLVEGTGDFKNKYRLERKYDEKVSTWWGKKEGKEWAMGFKKLDKKEFDNQAGKYKFT